MHYRAPRFITVCVVIILLQALDLRLFEIHDMIARIRLASETIAWLGAKVQLFVSVSY